MADEVQATEGQAEETHVEAPKVDTQVDQKAIQAEIDRQVAKGIKSYQENLAKKSQAEREAKEAEEAAKRGEFEKINALKDQELKQLKTQLVATNVMHNLTDTARQAGLIDMDDLTLLKDDAIAQAVAEDGSIDNAKLTELVNEFKTAKPHKFKGAEQVQNKPRFGGTPTPPPAPGQLPNQPKAHDHYGNAGLDAVVQARQENYKRITSRATRGNQDPLLALLAERLKN
jgi:hypothetical protein